MTAADEVSVTVAKPMRVSVAICTWNRCQSLRRTLQSLTMAMVPRDVEWEVLVVNNNCTDSTDDVIRSFEKLLPIRRLWEPVAGLSSARNRAVAEATGDYIVWTDDDVLVDADWLAAYVRAFRRWPVAAIFGGPIDPLFEDGPPAWIPAVMHWIGPVFGRQSLGDEPVRLDPEVLPHGPYGGNMAMRRSVQVRFPYDPTLGVRHGEYITGEETQVMMRMLETGVEGWWTPEPRVAHCIPRQAQTTAYVRRWFIGRGKGELRLGDEAALRQTRRPIRLVMRSLWHELRFRFRRHLVPPEEWIMDLMIAGKTQGTILGMARLRDGK
jgi:glucosyl-dolichyl phosphate glucuronosyltransferase